MHLDLSLVGTVSNYPLIIFISRVYCRIISTTNTHPLTLGHDKRWNYSNMHIYCQRDVVAVPSSYIDSQRGKHVVFRVYEGNSGHSWCCDTIVILRCRACVQLKKNEMNGVWWGEMG